VAWFYLGLWLLASVRAVRGFRELPRWPARVSGWLGLALSLLIGIAGGYALGEALRGRTLPEGPVVDLAAPLAPGTYFVAHGGATELVNAHRKTLDPSVERYRRWRGQSFAVDLLRTRPWQGTGGWLAPTEPAAYAIFGTSVRAPCAGRVWMARDRYPDMPVPKMDREHMAGNFVMLECGAYRVVLAHLRRGSVAVERGEGVAVGAHLGEVGNSGNSSQPHLHLHVQRGGTPEQPLSGEPVSFTLDGRYPARNQRLTFDIVPAD
jgi:hypothetical protein